jgi:hypothetical protein
MVTASPGDRYPEVGFSTLFVHKFLSTIHFCRFQYLQAGEQKI